MTEAPRWTMSTPECRGTTSWMAAAVPLSLHGVVAAVDPPRDAGPAALGGAWALVLAPAEPPTPPPRVGAARGLGA